MPGPKIAYQHFCPAARALEVIGEKWSLLIVRDLLAGPRRFSDLRRSLAAITPKWLSLRLRDLHEAGVIEREAAGQREVWYRLTSKGQALGPVIEDLMVWGIEHALRPPAPGEAIHPARAMDAFIIYLNRRGVRLDHPAVWVVRCTDASSFTLVFDGERWLRRRGEEPAEVTVETTPRAWIAFLSAGPEERHRLLAAEQSGEGSEFRIAGAPDRVDEFLRTLGRQEPIAADTR